MTNITVSISLVRQFAMAAEVKSNSRQLMRVSFSAERVMVIGAAIFAATGILRMMIVTQ